MIGYDTQASKHYLPWNTPPVAIEQQNIHEDSPSYSRPWNLNIFAFTRKLKPVHCSAQGEYAANIEVVTK